VRDVGDPPRRRAEEEHLADVALEDHLLVELTDAHRSLTFGPVEEDAVEAAIGDGPAARDRDALGPLARDERAADAVPRHARTQLGELVGRVASREHVEHALVGAAWE
jgi:hypothetical protein